MRFGRNARQSNIGIRFSNHSWAAIPAVSFGPPRLYSVADYRRQEFSTIIVRFLFSGSQQDQKRLLQHVVPIRKLQSIPTHAPRHLRTVLVNQLMAREDNQ